MAAVVNTDSSVQGISRAVFAVNGPQNTVGGFRNYWCNGSALTTANTAEGIISEGYGDFLSVTTTFLVLSESDPAQAEIIRLVKNGLLEEISPEATPALFNGTIVPSIATVRMANMSEGLDFQSTSVFNEGHVIAFKNEHKNRIGLMEIRTINLDRTQEKTYSDQNASLIFDLYYQR
ncbi:MAG: hypothetical protein LUF85_17515 [Bacteroides sp.]|nr:hypothetical protein [Bacteroides sp.]